MSFRTAANIVGNTEVLVYLILLSFQPVSSFHTDPDYKRIYEEQRRGGRPSDAHTLWIASRVSRKFQCEAEKLLWRDISDGEIKVYISRMRTLEYCNAKAASTRLMGLGKGKGSYIKSLYFSSQSRYAELFTCVFPRDPKEMAVLQNITHLRLYFYNRMAWWQALNFVRSTSLKSLSVTIRPDKLFKTAYKPYAKVISEWFGKLINAQYQPPAHIKLIVEDMELWRRIQPAFMQYLQIVSPAVRDLECHIDMLTPDFVANLNIDSIRGVGVSRFALLPDDKDEETAEDAPHDEILAGAGPNHSCLALCATLSEATNIFTNAFSPSKFTRLELALRNRPTQRSFINFLRIVGRELVNLTVLKVAFPTQVHSNAEMLDWDVLKLLVDLNNLEELEITNGPSIAIINTNLKSLTSAWPKLRVLKLVPHPVYEDEAFILSLGGIFFLVEQCTSLAELVVPFSFQLTDEQLLARATRLAHLAEDSFSHTIAKKSSVDRQQMERLAEDVDAMVIDEALLPMPKEHTEPLDAEVDNLVALSSAFTSAGFCDPDGHWELKIQRTTGEVVVVKTAEWYRQLSQYNRSISPDPECSSDDDLPLRSFSRK